MRTTILIVSVDEGVRLRDSLPAAAAQGASEVLVVDNASVDATAEVARDHGARVVHLPVRRTYCGAVNAGIAAADGDAVLLLNADCVLDEGFLDAALRHLDDPGVGSVAPKLLRARDTSPDGRLELIDAAGMFIDLRRRNGLVGHNEPASSFATAADAFGGDGAAVLYRRAVLADCALGDEVLDEDMALWAADADLAWRARRLGWRCVYEPRARAWHVRFYSPSTRGRLAPEHRRMQFRNRYLMMVKNDTLGGLARVLPVVLAWEVAALGHILLREQTLLPAYREVLAMVPAAWRRRRALRDKHRGRALAPVPFGLRPPA